MLLFFWLKMVLLLRDIQQLRQFEFGFNSNSLLVLLQPGACSVFKSAQNIPHLPVKLFDA